MAFRVWWLLHYLRVFANRDYSLLLVYRGDRLVHRSGVYPRYLRFPFMGRIDLQVGDTWTAEDERGRGLARFAVAEVVRRLSAPGRRFWYLCEPANTASVRVIERAGFRLAGMGEREPRFGVGVLGAFRLREPADSSRGGAGAPAGDLINLETGT